jgi:hypothetical protein
MQGAWITVARERGGVMVPAAILSDSNLAFSVSTFGEDFRFSAPGLDWGTIGYTLFNLRQTGFK